MKHTGKFIISLDFELLWGVRDKEMSQTYDQNILGVWEALPKLLQAFEEHNVRATFATVGFLFASTKKELIEYTPSQKPNYIDPNLSPYNGHFELVKSHEDDDQYHFASRLIEIIRQYPNQEIATHTFSHYYCLEQGQTQQDFRNDLLAAIKIAQHKGITLESLVFPRNQFNDEYVAIIKELGLGSYRGNERVWFHQAAKGEEESLFKRAFRLLDAYLNISGHHCYNLEEIAQKEPYDIPSSRFLRPYSTRLKVLEPLRLRRILKSMTYAAQHQKVYHLWWHPHNFGIHQKENFLFLDKILKHYVSLNAQFGFESLTMSDLSDLLKSSKYNG